MQPLSIKGLGLALGLTWGASIFLLGLAGAAGWGRALVEVLGSAYLGFHPSLGGSLIGGLWGFVDGTLGGIIIAWLYNRFC
ncbi:MAG: bacteriophage holin [Candidatus Methylomirabilales bacterium]